MLHHFYEIKQKVKEYIKSFSLCPTSNMKATNFGKFILVHGSPEAARLVRKQRVATVKL